MNTRAMAAAILLRIRDHGAYSNVLLPQATRELSRPNQSFVFSLVMGSLRRMRAIDATIEAASGRAIDDLDPEVSAILEIAVGEMLNDDQNTAYATVNESVEAIKQLGFGRAAGLVNGVLRNLSRNGMPTLPGDKAQEFSVPEWVLGRITHDHGRRAARELLAGLRLPAPGVGIRVRPGGVVPVDAEPIVGISGAYRVARLPEERDGVIVGDGASSAVAQAVAVRAGEHILDMAAAPGGKTSSLWDQGEGSGVVVAMDNHGRRLESARARLAREGIDPVWVQADGTHAPFVDGVFDAVLLDAPCTGLGTLRRRPEIAMRLKTASVETLAAIQRELLAEAWRVTRPGGRIIYSVCTIFAAETIDIVADYPASPPEGLPGIQWGKGLLLAPHITETDGMFVTAIQR